eukprot:scaffold50704_cov22-Cyclotella_meneghiniana.AAC.4
MKHYISRVSIQIRRDNDGSCNLGGSFKLHSIVSRPSVSNLWKALVLVDLLGAYIRDGTRRQIKIINNYCSGGSVEPRENSGPVSLSSSDKWPLSTSKQPPDGRWGKEQRANAAGVSLSFESDVGVVTTSSGSVSLSSNYSGESISWTLNTGEATDEDSGLVFF